LAIRQNGRQWREFMWGRAGQSKSIIRRLNSMSHQDSIRNVIQCSRLEVRSSGRESAHQSELLNSSSESWHSCGNNGWVWFAFRVFFDAENAEDRGCQSCVSGSRTRQSLTFPVPFAPTSLPEQIPVADLNRRMHRAHRSKSPRSLCWQTTFVTFALFVVPLGFRDPVSQPIPKSCQVAWKNRKSRWTWPE
jgi:hypothetical protein